MHTYVNTYFNLYTYIPIYGHINTYGHTYIHTYIRLPTMLECYVTNVLLVNERGEIMYVQLQQARSTRSARATCCPRHGVLLPGRGGTYEMKKFLLTLSLANWDRNLKIYELFIHRDTRSALFWDITRCRVVIIYRRFGTTYPSPSSRVKSPRREQVSSTSLRKPEKHRDIHYSNN